MAIPLTAGAVAAMRDRTRPPGVAAALAAAVRALGTRRGWLAVSLAVMLLALILSFSRSALVAGLVAVACWCVLGVGRTTRRGLAAALVAAALLGLVVAWAAPAQPILARLRETLALGTAGRAAIWADARGVARAYPVTGTGLATFERSMLIYQTSDRQTRTNQAHSQYLQLLAEGGALLPIPTVLVCLAFGWVARRRLREDDSPAVWLRIGSLAGLAGVAVQGVWETGLRMPANGVLLAVVAAIAVHRPLRPSEPPDSR
jgi:O-antigen ligase